MNIFKINFKKIISIFFIVLLVSNSSTFSFANNVSQNTVDLEALVNDQVTQVSEKWKIVLNKESFERSLNVNSEYLQSISAKQIYPSIENLDYKLILGKSDCILNISIPNKKEHEVVVEIKYEILNNDKFLEELANDKSLFFYQTDDSLENKPARASIKINSKVNTVKSSDKTYFFKPDGKANIALNKPSKESESKGEAKKTHNNQPLDSSKNDTDSKEDSNSITAPQFSKKKSFATKVKTFFVDTIVLIVCTLSVIAIVMFIITMYAKSKSKKNTKFNNSRRTKNKKRKKSFKRNF